jgi:hypothetical protein
MDEMIGFVKGKPEKLSRSNWFGREKITVPDRRYLVVSVLKPGKHKYELYGPGVRYVNTPLFSDQEAQYILISIEEEHMLVQKDFNRTINFRSVDNPQLSVGISAVVRYHVIPREDDIRAALDYSLSVDSGALGKLNTNFQQYVNEAFAAVVNSTHLLIFREKDGWPLIGVSVKARLDADGRPRREMAIEIVGVSVQNIALGKIPGLLPSVTDFIKYRGPIDLSPNCLLLRDRGLMPELWLDVRPDELALVYSDKQRIFLPGKFHLQREGLADPQLEMILLSTAQYDLSFQVHSNHYFQFLNGFQGEKEITANITLRYQISAPHLQAITFDTANTFLDETQRRMFEVCGQILREAPTRALYEKVAISTWLRDGLVRMQPFEQTLGIRVISAFVTDILDLPPWPESPLLDKQVIRLLAEERLDPTGRYLQVPRNAVALIPTSDGVRLLPAGDHDFKKLGLRPVEGIKLISTDDYPLQVIHTFKPLLPLGGELAELEVSMTVTLYNRAVITDWDDPDQANALDSLSPNDDRRKQLLESRLRSAIEVACTKQGLALLQKFTPDIQMEIERDLTEKLREYGLGARIDVANIEHPPELYQAIMAHHQARIQLIEQAAEARLRLLDSMTDADARRAFAERLPPFSLNSLLQPGSEQLAQYCNNALQAVSLLGERSASGEEMIKAFNGLYASLGGLSSSPSINTPPDVTGVENTVVDMVQKVEKITSENLDQIDEDLETKQSSGTTNRPMLQLPLLFEHLDNCRKMGVGVPTPKGDLIALVFKFSEGSVQRLRILLRGFEDYPEVEPVVVECKQITAEGEEHLIHPILSSLTDWHPGSSVMDLAKEIISKKGAFE